MSQDRLERTLQEAIRVGILPPTASRPTQDNRPWPVVLLTALGAWLAAIPLLLVIGLLLGELIRYGIGTYIVGLLVLTGAGMILRSRDVPLFVEQLAVPGLLVGGTTLGFGLFRDLPPQMAATVLALLAISIAWAIHRTWLRVLLGAAAAILMMIAFSPRDGGLFDGLDITGFWFALHTAFALWVAAGWIQRNVLNDGARARQAAALESVLVGWLLVTLAGLALWAGRTFLVGGSFSEGALGEVAQEFGRRGNASWEVTAIQSVSALLALGAAAWMASRWPTLREPWWAGVAAVLIGLCWLMPTLGAVLLALAFCISTGRTLLAATAGMAAAWIIGAFYYQLSWPLAMKAIVMVAAGSVLAALSWLAAHKGKLATATRIAPSTPTLRRQQAGILTTVLLVLSVANIGIWQKEELIQNGQPVFIEMAPVDPRSLMQGDYMELSFRLPDQVWTDLAGANNRQRPRIVGRRDARGVASLLRMDKGSPLGKGEFLFELTPKNGNWVLVSDAWFFKEGEGERWAQAQYGEFRVSANGRALLVGLRGANLERL